MKFFYEKDETRPIYDAQRDGNVFDWIIVASEDLREKEIENLCKDENNINNLKIKLANEATKILHGASASKKAELTAKETFDSGGSGSELPEIKIKSIEINNGINFLDFLSKNKITSSKSEARRTIANKGLRIDNVIVEDENKVLYKNDFKKNMLKVSFGKKKHYLVKII